MAAAAVISVSTGGGIASAATSSTLLYSTDGGATWTSDATVAAGGTVLVRQWYDNDGSAAETGASLATQLPEGFTLNGGSTQVCLNPSTTNPTSPDGSELVCAASNEGAVWSGTDLQISPTAGHYGESSGQTVGTLVSGRVRYLNLHSCFYKDQSTDDIFYTSAGGAGLLATGTNASNTAGTTAVCGAGGPNPTLGGNYEPSPLFSTVRVLDLLGNRYLNLHRCTYQNAGNDDVFMTWAGGAGNFGTGTNASNVEDADPATCGPGGTIPGNPGIPDFYEERAWTNVVRSMDVLDNRYVNLHQCFFQRSTGSDVFVSIVGGAGNFASGTNASNTADPTATCAPGGTFLGQSYPLVAAGSTVRNLDLLDPARGRGYVEYSLTAPAAPTPEACASNPSATSEAFDQDGSLTSTPSGVQAASGTITVDWSALDEPCPVDPIPLGDPLVTAGGLGVLAGAAYVLHRRRMVTTA